MAESFSDSVAFAPTQPLSWVDGEYDAVQLSAPSAGANLAYKVAGGAFERLRTLSFLFTASAAVANRTMILRYLDADGGVLYQYRNNTAQTANQIVQYSFLPNFGNELGPTTVSVIAPIPDAILWPGWQIVTAITNIDIADTLTVVRSVRERIYRSGEAF